MELQPDSVTADLTNDGIAAAFDIFIDGVSHISEEFPRLDLLQALLKRLLCGVDKRFLFRADLTDAEHARGIGEVTVEIGGNVHIDNIAVFKDNILRGNTMAHLVIYGGTNALRKALIIQRRRNTAHSDGDIMHPAVNLRSGYSCPDMLRHIVEHRDIDLGAFLDLFNLFLCLEQAVVGNLMSLRLDFFHSLVKIDMALLIFFAASAPAFVVSARLLHAFILLLSVMFHIIISRSETDYKKNVRFYCQVERFAV